MFTDRIVRTSKKREKSTSKLNEAGVGLKFVFQGDEQISAM